MQNKMQRRLGQLTGTCFQRCVGMDALQRAPFGDLRDRREHGTDYHERFRHSSPGSRARNHVIGGAMTDVKGDRGKAPHQQADPDLFVHVSRRTDEAS